MDVCSLVCLGAVIIIKAMQGQSHEQQQKQPLIHAGLLWMRQINIHHHQAHHQCETTQTVFIRNYSY